MKHSKHKSVNRYHADQDGAWGTDALEARRELIRRHYDENAQKRIAYIKRNAYFYDLIGGVFGHLIGSGAHICYISDLSKLKSHFPSWGLTRYFDDILEEMVEFEMHKLKAV